MYQFLLITPQYAKLYIANLSNLQFMSRKIRRDNVIGSSPYYGEIMKTYNERMQSEGYVNKREFFLEVVKPKVNCSERTWYGFIKNLELTAGVMDTVRQKKQESDTPQILLPAEEIGPNEIASTQQQIVTRMADNATATRNLISRMLNIGADAAQELINNPEKLSAEKRVDIALKAMRAQDSRIFAVAAVKKDRREEKAFQTSFNDAAYQEEIFDEEEEDVPLL